MGKWGHFSEDGSEFIITRPDTPRPWVNYLTNGTYCAICSATGGGYSFVGDPGYNRITALHSSGEMDQDHPGRYLYVHEVGTGNIWSLNWQPVKAKLQSFEARVGLGYTTIHSRTQNLESDVCYFVPRDDNMEFWMVDLKNHAKTTRTFRIYTYVELTLGNFHADGANRSFENLFNLTWFKQDVLFGTKTRWNHPGKGVQQWDKIAFLTANIPIDGYESLRERFLGQHQSLSAPAMVKKGEMPHQVGSHADAIGTLAFEITLAAGEQTEFDVMLGTVEHEADAFRIRRKYAGRGDVAAALDGVRDYWDLYNNHLLVRTPDADFNIATSWTRYQNSVTSQWSQMHSDYIPGSGSWRFRDEAQQIFGTLPHVAGAVKQKLHDLLIHQFKSGLCVHTWDSATKRGKVTHHSDDPQWLAMAIIHYIKETGDLSYLDESVAYYDGGRGTVMEHLLAALKYTIRHSSARGIPLRLTADWNDALGGSTQHHGESMVVGNQLAWNIRELLPILQARGEKELHRGFQARYHHLFDELNSEGWDGQWYLRATDAAGHNIGSQLNAEGKVFLDAQSWPILSGVADYDPENSRGTTHHPYARGIMAMNNALRKLETPFGPALFWPLYTKKNAHLGVISEFVPGAQENGSILLQSVALAVIALCIAGRGDDAYEIWRRSSFINRSKDPNYPSEPYVYPEFMYGPSHLKFGQGSITWISGSAAWFYRACTDWILGVRPTLAGLVIDPCVPKHWTKWTVERDFRGSRYIIHCQNPHGRNSGVEDMIVDGQHIAGNVLPYFHDNKTHHIQVTLQQ